MYECELYQGEDLVASETGENQSQLILWARQVGRYGDRCLVYSTVTTADGRQEKVSLEVDFLLTKKNRLDIIRGATKQAV